MKTTLLFLSVFLLAGMTITSCVNYTVRVMEKPDNTSIEICKEVTYLGTRNLSGKTTTEGYEPGEFIDVNRPKNQFTYYNLIERARKDFKDSTVLVTNVKWDIKEFNLLNRFFWQKFDGVTYDVIKCD